MAKKLDPIIAETLKKFGFGPDAAWDCHGTWVVYHRVLEQIAAKGGIVFDDPTPLETNGAAKSVAICVTGHLGDRKEWSIGEASPANNKNGYPYAMAEKRAKDRVILKLIGLHGLAFSEDEADDFKDSAPKPTPAPAPQPDISPQARAAAKPRMTPAEWAEMAAQEILTCRTPAEFTAWLQKNSAAVDALQGKDKALYNALSAKIMNRNEELARAA